MDIVPRRPESDGPRKTGPRLDKVVKKKDDLQDDDLVSLLARGKLLQKRFRDNAAHLRAQVESDSRFEATKEQVATWREDVKLLTHHVSAQLKYCQDLREGKTLSSLLRGDPETEEKRQAHQYACQLKSDIRSMHHLLEDIKEQPVFVQPTDKSNVTESEVSDASQWELTGKGSEMESNATKLESRLAKVPVYSHPQTELDSDYYYNAGAGEPSGAKCTEKALAELTTKDLNHLGMEHQRLITGILQKILAEKSVLESSLGMREDSDDNLPWNQTKKDTEGKSILNKSKKSNNNRKGSPSVSSSSSEFAKLLVSTVKAFRHLVRIAKTLGYVGDGVGIAKELQLLRDENVTLKQAKHNAETQVKLLETTVASLKEELGGKTKLMMVGKQAVRLEEARQRVMQIEQTLTQTQRRNAKLLLENGQLCDSIARLRDEMEVLRQTQKQESSFLRPRLEGLMEMVLATATMFDSMALDVELLTNMYSTTCEALGQKGGEVDHLKSELEQISGKFRKLIKLMQEEKTESQRKDKVITALMGTRHEMAKTVKELQAKAVRAEENVANTAKLLKQRDVQLDQMQAEKARMREALSKAEAGQRVLLERLERMEQDKVEETKKHEDQVKSLTQQINSLKTAGMDRATRDAYDEMQLRLKHAIMAYQKLEEKLNHEQRRRGQMKS